MAQDTTPAIIVYRGNGDNSVPYDVPFNKGYYGDIKVLFVRRGLADYTYNPTTYTVNGRLYAWFSGTGYVYTHTPNPAVGTEIYNNFDEDAGNTVSAVSGQTITDGVTTYTRAVQHDIANQLLLTWTGEVLTSDDFICIARETECGQPYTFPNNQKHIEGALDNIERQVQENKDKLDNALLVDPSHTTDTTKMNPLDWMKSIIRCMDFSVRGLRCADGWLDYSLDDPNKAEEDKTWVHLLNTDNVKSIRERSTVIDGVTVYFPEYLSSDGSWRAFADSPAAVNTKVDKSGDTMTGALVHAYGSGSKYNTNLSTSYFNVYVNQTEFRIEHKYGSYNGNLVFRSYTGDATLYPNNDDRAIFGLPTRKWNRVYTTHLCSDSHGANVITIPDDKNDTLAVLGDIAFKSTDVTITSATAGQYLQYDGSKWVNATFSGANTDLSNLSAEGKKMLYHPELLSFQWSDHEIEDMSWLRADTFSWQSGTTYSEAYDHLVDDIDGKLLTSETIAGTTVQFYVADDGHKICPASEESNVSAIYTATGVAWYYIIDTANTRFKLPRTKFGMTGLRDTVGNYVAPGLPNITGKVNAWTGASSGTGALKAVQTGTAGLGGSIYNVTGEIELNAHDSNSIYSDSVTTVQPPATQMYLYFYVGPFTETALENTAGLNASLFNGKADVDAQNFTNSAKSFLSELAMPGTRYDELTLGVTGSEYTAPANGYFVLSKEVGGSDYSIMTMTNTTTGLGTTSNNNLIDTDTCIIYMPCAAGQTVRVDYSYTGTTNYFRFIYTIGEGNS